MEEDFFMKQIGDAKVDDRRKFTIQTQSAEDFPDETDGVLSLGGSDLMPALIAT